MQLISTKVCDVFGKQVEYIFISAGTDFRFIIPGLGDAGDRSFGT